MRIEMVLCIGKSWIVSWKKEEKSYSIELLFRGCLAKTKQKQKQKTKTKKQLCQRIVRMEFFDVSSFFNNH